MLGIFFPSISEAVQTKSESVSVVGTYTATFSFNIGEFSARTNVFPDRVYFNSSGTNQVFSNIPAHDETPGDNFSAWEDSYSLDTWSAPQSTTVGQFTPFTNVGQIPSTTSTSFSPGSFCLAAIANVPASTSYRLMFSNYNSESDLFSTPSFAPIELANNVNFKTPAMVISQNKVYVCWLSNNDSSIHMLELNDSSPPAEILLSPADVKDTYGLGGGLVKIDGNDNIVILYGNSLNKIGIVYFRDGQSGSQTVTSVAPTNFSGQHADICQNPRTGYIYLSWLDGSTQYILKSNLPNKLDFTISNAVALGGTWSGTRGLSLEAFDNFEVDLGLLSSGGSVNNLAIKTPVTTVQAFGENANAQVFAYENSGKKYAGILNSLGFEYRFRRRLLKFPLLRRWQKSNKLLHLEGPPIPATQVKAEVDFAEIATASCIAQTVNSAGNRTSFVANSNIIASQGNVISIVFDKDMNLNNSLIDDKIKVFDASNNAVAITTDSTPQSREIKFRLNQNLSFSSSYYILVARDILDANGSEIWAESRLNFTTQPSKSSVLASEVVSLKAYSTSARNAGDQFADGVEINATTTVYLRLEAVDPAYNTIDVATVTLFLNGSSIAEIPMTQTSVNSSFFDGQYNLRAPHGGNNLFEFISPAAAIKTSVRVDFPTLSSVSPNNGDAGVLIDRKPQLTFSENIAPASVNGSSIKLLRGITPANYSLSLSGAAVTIDPADSSEGYLLTGTTYNIAAGYGITDLKGNPFVHSPATFTSSFTTQASQTRPLAISQAKLFSDSAYSSLLITNSDYAATGTIYVEFTGTDGSNLTKDYAIASISNGILLRLEETASASAIYRGSYSFSSLGDRFQLRVQSVKTPAVSESLLITYPRLTPENPASAAVNVPLAADIVIAADEALNPAEVNNTSVKLFLDGSEVSKTVGFAAGKITINPDSDMSSSKTYVVRVENVKDLSGNPLLQPLIYQFTCADVIPPQLTPESPASGSTDVSLAANLVIAANETLSAAEINDANIKLFLDGVEISKGISYAAGKITINPVANLLEKRTYIVRVENLKDLSGNVMAAPLIYQFTCEDITPPQLTPESPASGTSNVSLTADLTITANEALNAADINNSNLKLFLDGVEISKSLSYSSDRITINPDSDLLSERTYLVSVNAVRDLSGNSISNPLIYTFTCEDKTPPQLTPENPASGSVNVALAISPVISANEPLSVAEINDTNVRLLLDGAEISKTLGYAAEKITIDPVVNLLEKRTYTVRIENIKDLNGNLLAAPLIYQFTSEDITPPQLSPTSPASGATNVSLTGNLTITADEALNAGDINDTNLKLFLDGVEIGKSLSYAANVITINPNADLLSERTYLVRVNSLRDLSGNAMANPLIYQFTCEDKTPPTISAFFPAQNQTGVTIDQLIRISFSENILPASVNSSSVKLTRNGTSVSTVFNISGNTLTIDPNDSSESYLRPDSSYQLEINAGLTDLSGNSINPAPFVLNFSTQPGITQPTVVKSLTLFKDPLLLTGWSLHEKVPASATIYLKLTGDDGATQTRDLATAVLNLSWNGNREISLYETASNSSGIFTGQFSLNSLPLYGFPTPQPPVSIGSLTFFARQTPTKAATLTVSFPEPVVSATTVDSLTGTVSAANANAVRIDSSIFIAFNEELLEAGTADAIAISSGSSAIIATRNLSSDRKKIVITPASPLPFASSIKVEGIYGETGIKSSVGNPIYRNFSFSFNTQASQTLPLSISQLSLFADNSFSAPVAFAENDDFAGTGVIFVEVKGADGANNTVDSTVVDISHGATKVTSLRLLETSINSGIFRGQYAYSNLADNIILTISSAQSPAVKRALKLSYPSLTQSFPASGAANVSIFTSFSVQANETLDQSQINQNNVKLWQGSSPVAINLNWNSTERKIEVSPQTQLDFAGNYLLTIDNQRDLAGNSQVTHFASRFSTQSSSVAPTSINSIKAFSDSAYSALISAPVQPSSQAYFEISATDLSPTTIDSTLISMSSPATTTVLQTSLIETGAATGIFRGSLRLFAIENATITIVSNTDNSVNTTITTLGLPLISSFEPASGSSNIKLDTRFKILTNKPVNSSTINNSSIILSDASGIASYLPVLTSPQTITVFAELEANSAIKLRVTNLLTDTDSIAFPNTIAEFSSIARSTSGFRLFSDSGFSTEISNNSQIEIGKTVWAEITGANIFDFKTESQNLLLSTPDFAQTLVLPENSAGVFRASFTIPDYPGQVLLLTPQGNSSLARQLNILADFAITSFFPASGAVSVPADTWPTWNFNRPVNSLDLNTSKFKLIKVEDGSLVSGQISQSPTTKQVRFQPDQIFDLLSEYEMVADGSVRDENNNPLKSGLRTRFVTQPPPAPPTVISLFDNFESSDYATSTRAVATNGTLYLKMVSTDTSFSTYETARVRLDSSDGSLDGIELTLIEISPPSGIFVLAYPVSLTAGTSLSIQPQVAPTKKITVTAFNRTNLVKVEPASGSQNLLLDTPLRLSFSQPILESSISSGLNLFANTGISFSTSVENSGRDLVIKASPALATGTINQLKINTNLKDNNGLFLLPNILNFSTVGESLAEFELLTGLPPRDNQKVSQTKEAVFAPLNVVATTTNLFAATPEFRELIISAATQSFRILLSETQPGNFSGTFSPLEGTSQTGLVASLSFANRPSLSFNFAAKPQLVETFPASATNEAREYQPIIATFSRPMAFESGQNAATIFFPGGQTSCLSLNQQDSQQMNWQPQLPLPVQASCALVLDGLTDYLGQPLNRQVINFSTSGLQGINLYNDSTFNLRIATETLQFPVAYAEIAASSTTSLANRSFNLEVRTGTRATTTVQLPLQAVASSSSRFRCKLEFAPSKSLPGYNVPLLPGEWLELTSPELTNDKKIFYYRFSGAAEPIKIHSLSLYQEKDFAQKLNDVLPLASLYIQIEAEDLNWFTTDSTSVRVYSDADPTGFSLKLTEAGTHSNFFRGMVQVDGNRSNAALARILAQPGNRITVESETDAAISASLVYLPESGLRAVSAFPSPARGNSIFFRFYLNFPGNVEIEIFDSAGHEIDSVYVRGREGENRHQWRFPRHLANGVYFYVMKLTDSTAYPNKKRKYRGKFAVLR